MSSRDPLPIRAKLGLPSGKRRDDDRSLAQASKDWLRAAFMENATLKLVAFMLALTLFFLVHSDKRSVVNLSVGVSYSLPDDKVLASRPPPEVRLTVRGSRRLIKRVDEREIERIHVDLPDTNGEFVFQNEMVKLPAGLELVSINPASFPLRIESPTTRKVPIEISLSGRLPRGYTVAGKSVEPDKVDINGAESLVKSTESVSTRPVALDGRSKSFTEQVLLAEPDDLLNLVDAPRTVTVTVEVAPELGTRKLGKQPVVILPGPGIPPEAQARFSTVPDAVDVTLSGPILTLEAIDHVTVEVGLAAADLVPGTERDVPVLIRGLPEGVASEVHPSEVRLHIR